MAEVGYDTLLEGDLPEEVANYSSLSTFAGKTQTDWEDEIWGAEDTRWGGILAGLFTGLENVGSFVLSLLQTIANAVFGGITFVFETVSQGLEELGTNFGSWWESVSRANTTSLINSTGSLAAAVSGGVAVYDEFDGASSNDLGAAWDVFSDGAGSGFYGLSGLGRAEWKPSGALARRHVNVYGTPLGTDYQVVSCVVGTNGLSVESDPAFTYLIGRCNDAGDTFVWARFSRFELELGYTDSGVYTPFTGAAVDLYIGGGAEVQFFLGTDSDEREFVVKVNGYTYLSYTDSGDVTSMGASYLNAGLAASAAPTLGIAGLTQAEPASLSAWTASDRLAAEFGS